MAALLDIASDSAYYTTVPMYNNAMRACLLFFIVWQYLVYLYFVIKDKINGKSFQHCACRLLGLCTGNRHIFQILFNEEQAQTEVEVNRYIGGLLMGVFEDLP